MSWTITIDGDLPSNTLIAAELRSIAWSISNNKKTDKIPLFKINGNTYQQPLLFTETEEIPNDEKRKFGLSELEWKQLIIEATEYMERWGLNDTLSWLMSKQAWGQFEARTLIAEIGHTEV